MNEIMPMRDKKSLFIIAMEQCKGIVSQACEMLGFNHNTVYRWIRDDDEFREACKETRSEYLESLLDKAEDVVEAYIHASDKQAAQWFLSKKGTERGYGKHITVALEGDAFKDLEFPDEPDSIEEWEQTE